MDSAQLKMKRCTSCQANLPIESFGTNKYFSTGFNLKCKECRSQFFRLERKRKFNAKNRIDDSLIREVKAQNIAVLEAIIGSTTTTEIRGFDCHTKIEYKIFYGPSERVNLPAMTLFTRSGEVFMEWALSGVKDVKATLLAYLKAHNIRLEMSDADVIRSKIEIYYL